MVEGGLCRFGRHGGLGDEAIEGVQEGVTNLSWLQTGSPFLSRPASLLPHLPSLTWPSSPPPPSTRSSLSTGSSQPETTSAFLPLASTSLVPWSSGYASPSGYSLSWSLGQWHSSFFLCVLSPLLLLRFYKTCWPDRKHMKPWGLARTWWPTS